MLFKIISFILLSNIVIFCNRDSKINSDVEIIKGDTPSFKPKKTTICDVSLQNTCITHLPIAIFDTSSRFARPEFYHQSLEQMQPLMTIDTTNSADYSYSIVDGNPTYTLKRTDNNNITNIYNMNGYRIDDEGNLYVQDVWLLSRNSSEYSDPNVQEVFYDSVKYGRQIQRLEESCNTTSNHNEVDCSKTHNYLFDYTFGRTETDNITIEITNNENQEKKQVIIQVQPNPKALDLKEKCTSTDPLYKWTCIHSKEDIFPEQVIDKEYSDSLIQYLPEQLTKNKEEYELVSSLEFDNAEQTNKFFLSLGPLGFGDSSGIQFQDGKMILEHNLVQRGGGKCNYVKQPYLTSKGQFEFTTGYLEMRYTKYPRVRSSGGNAIIWSRYGQGHPHFLFVPPAGVFAGRSSLITREDLAHIGYTEIDFIERPVDNQLFPYFVVHTYPVRSSNEFDYYNITLPNISLPLQPNDNGYEYVNWDSYRTLAESVIYSIEITPNQGIRVFLDKKLIKASPRSDDLFYRGAALHISLIRLFLHVPQSCSQMESQTIELDYMRFYKPSNGY